MQGRSHDHHRRGQQEPGLEQSPDRAAGLGNKEIARDLDLSLPTVKAHLVNIFNKMGVGSRTEAVLHALRRGWIHIEDVSAEPPPDGHEGSAMSAGSMG